ncbi:MAG: exodeoxyribonuclease VII small subunit [Muribaculaceae bacterium]|nr:exodeoxyribonuclease VII small subunit [Muribaculaceae bacterium]
MDKEKIAEEIKGLSYSEAMAQLEEIVRKMQSNDCDIDLLSEYTTRAMLLLKSCKERLTKTDEELKKCIEELS